MISRFKKSRISSKGPQALLSGQVFKPQLQFFLVNFIQWETPAMISHNLASCVGHVRSVQDLIISVWICLTLFDCQRRKVNV